MAVKKETWDELTPEQRVKSIYESIKEDFLTKDVKGFIYIARTSDGHIVDTWGELSWKGTIGAFLEHMKKVNEEGKCTTAVVME